jgi:AP-3 complex subunit delta-1
MGALNLVVGMVNSDNLMAIVGRLMRQLRNSPIASSTDDPANGRARVAGVIPIADSDESDAEESLRVEKKSNQSPPLPEDYRVTVIQKIIEMCSRDTYTNIADFDWYVDVLVQLVRVCPATKTSANLDGTEDADLSTSGNHGDVSYEIGQELRNVAVRVRSVRPEAVEAAQSLVLVDKRDQMFPASGNGGQGVLECAGWLVGEYANLLSKSDGVMTSLLHSSTSHLPSRMLVVYLQAIPKVFASMSGNEQISWTPERRSLITLLMARIVHFLEPLAMHPNLEVQERAVEYLELMRLASEAASGTEPGHDNGDFVDPPLLLTQAIPALFTGLEINPVAPGAQRKVPFPEDLDLDTPINSNLQFILQQAELETIFDADEDDVYQAYNERIGTYNEPSISISAADHLDAPKSEPASYQNAVEEEYLDPDILARRKAERRERYKDDPFYIDPDRDRNSGDSTPLHNIIKNSNGEGLDIDAIPIMDLELEKQDRGRDAARPSQRKPRRNVEIIVDETLGPDEASSSGDGSRPDLVRSAQARGKKSLLEVDSSGLGALSLEDDGTGGSKLDMERREQEEAEMAKALKEVERLRLEMQRAAERIHIRDAPPEGTLVKRKKKKVRKAVIEGAEEKVGVEAAAAVPEGEDGEGVVMKKKKKKKAKVEGDGVGDVPGDGAEGVVKPKKKKKKQQVLLDEPITETQT